MANLRRVQIFLTITAICLSACWVYLVKIKSPLNELVKKHTSLLSKQDMEVTSIGTLVGIKEFPISANTSGEVVDIFFHAGQLVKNGDLLILVGSTQVLAPFTGRIGFPQINRGEYIAEGTTIGTLQALNPLYVQFNIPEQELASVRLEQPIEVSINQANLEPILTKAKINTISARANQTEKRVYVTASLSNPDLLLHPGMVALVKIKHRNVKSNQLSKLAAQ